jgi:hypothetical protein
VGGILIRMCGLLTRSSLWFLDHIATLFHPISIRNPKDCCFKFHHQT